MIDPVKVRLVGGELELRDRQPSPEARAGDRAALRSTLAALQRLPEVDRTALLMHVDGGLPYEEIAAALAISPGTARVKVHRARLKLAAARDGDGAPTDLTKENPT